VAKKKLTAEKQSKNEILKKRFAKRLRRWRELRGFGSQKEAAEALGVNVYNYRNWEYAHRLPTSYTKDRILRQVLPETELLMEKDLRCS